MEGKILKISSVFLTLTLAAAMATLGHFSGIHKREIKRQQMSDMQMFAYYKPQKEEIVDEEFLEQLCIELPRGMALEEVVIENDYVKQLVSIQIPDVGEDYFERHPLLGKSSHIEDLYMENGRIDLTLDAVYELDCSLKNGRLYVDLLEPHQVYDKVVVIDAGHGGRAPGAIKQGIMEKDINFAVVKELKALLDQNDRNIGVYYTRTEDVNPTFEQRAQLGGKANANLFISVHSNSADDGQMSKYHGTEVMYDEEKSEEGFSSKRLAQICLEEVTKALGSKDNGVTHGNGIYIIRNSQVPVALIEMGFMTNQEELDKLTSQEYQKQAAQGIYHAILRALDEGF